MNENLCQAVDCKCIHDHVCNCKVIIDGKMYAATVNGGDGSIYVYDIEGYYWSEIYNPFYGKSREIYNL